jgi:hypothetical protein
VSIALGRVAVLGAVVVLLSGCGSARPGVAAEVGDDTITVSAVDELADDVCTLQESLPEGSANQPQTTSGLVARDGALQSLILRSIADQMAADYGFTAGQDYQAQVDRLRLQFGSVDEDKVEAALPAYSSIPYFIDIMTQIGETTGDVAGDQALTAGIKQAQDWQSEHPVTTNPMFGSFNIGDQEIESTRDDLAFPASESAKDASSGSADYYASLPESQRCG